MEAFEFDEGYTPTEDEAAAIDHAALVAAWRELQPIKGPEWQLPQGVKAVLRAVRAADEAAKMAMHSLKQSRPEASYVAYHISGFDAACSALSAVDCELDGLSEISARSFGGARILAAAKAAIAMDAMSTFDASFDDDSLIGDGYSAMAIELADLVAETKASERIP